MPVINAGAGGTQHPTQALIDVFAMHQRFGGVDGLRIGLMGDLSCSRSARSLLRLLARYEPKELRLLHPGGPLTPETLAFLRRELTGAMWGRRPISRAWMSSTWQVSCGGGPLANDPERREIRARLSLNRSNVSGLLLKALILCPMPLIDEISRELDDAPEMGMFQQSMDGLDYVWLCFAFVCAPQSHNWSGDFL